MSTRIATFPIFALAILVLSACGTTATPPIDSAPAKAAQTASTATAGVAAEASVPVINPDNYKLGQGDKITIQVFDEPDLSMDATVSTSGVINYSYLGDVTVRGKTPYQLEQFIAGLLRDGYLVNPSVNVSVTEYRPFFIGGEVRAPGSYPYKPGLTLDQAIALAGGLTDRASQRQMYIKRSGAGPGSLQRGALGDQVGPGDTVTIKEGFF